MIAISAVGTIKIIIIMILGMTVIIGIQMRRGVRYKTEIREKNKKR